MSTKRKKGDERMPDFYRIRLEFRDTGGFSETFEVVNHGFVNGNILELHLTTDIYVCYPVEVIRRMEFDKNFSTVVSLRAEKIRELTKNAPTKN